MGDNEQVSGSINRECCCFNMRKVSRAVTQFFDRDLEDIGIRSTQFTLLVELNTTSARTLTEIADSLVMDRTTLTRNLKPLEKMELISTVPTIDKRSKAYVLTDAGKAMLARAIPLWQKAQNNILSSMSEENYRDLVGKMAILLTITSDAKHGRKFTKKS